MAWVVLLISRILILTENYTWPIDPVRLEMLYLLLLVALVLVMKKGVLSFRWGAHWYVLGVFLLHTLLWGRVFVDDRFSDLIFSHFKSQIMFAVILVITVWGVQTFHAEQEFIEYSFWALSCTLVYFLITHISEVDLSNLANILSASDRTRANFGFGHYNTLGAACVCNILMLDTIRNQRESKRIHAPEIICLCVSVIMLLCCASRSAITSLVLYFLVYAVLGMDEWKLPKRHIFAIRFVVLLSGAALVVCLLLFASMEDFLIAAQRSHLFKHTLPMFFKTEKVWLGLGYASNVAYAMKQTPYVTYWLDNGYIYLLVTTGFVGLGVLLSALWCIAAGILKNIRVSEGKRLFAVFCVYLYVSLFETVLFNSGVITNYIYLSWFALTISQNKGKGDVRMNGELPSKTE